MVKQLQIRSISFDTSFLLKNDSFVDRVMEVLVRDHIACFVTSTVASELEQLRVWGRITESTHKKAIKRLIHVYATVIDFKNQLLSEALGQACIRSMEEYGIPRNHVINDCNILVSSLKNGVDLFLSEDFHFTSAITKEVITKVKSAACTEYHLMCDSKLYSIDTKTFLDAYSKGTIDLDIVQSRTKRNKKNRLPNQ